MHIYYSRRYGAVFIQGNGSTSLQEPFLDILVTKKSLFEKDSNRIMSEVLKCIMHV